MSLWLNWVIFLDKHFNMHIRVHFVHGCHIQGYTWVIHFHLITRCYRACWNVCQEILPNLTINTFLFIILETILCCTIHDVSSNKCTGIKTFKTGLCHTIVPQIISNCWTLLCRTIQAHTIVSKLLKLCIVVKLYVGVHLVSTL
jgi:hypothetical protein